jgi:hypothetical protein
MANSLTNIVPQMLVRGLSVLRESVQMPFLVNRAYESEAAQRGDTVTIPVPSAMIAKDVQPGLTPTAAQDVTPTLVNIPLDKWRYADFTMTDKDLVEIQEGYLPLQAESAVKALANKIDTDLIGLGSQFYGAAGTVGTDVDAVKDIVECRKVLNEQLAPVDNRNIVISPAREAEMLSIPAFHDASFGVGGEAILEGRITRRLGFGIAMDQNVMDFEAGDSANGVLNGAASEGDTTVAIDGGTGSYVAGDLVSFAGHDQTYVVTAGGTASGVTISIQPALQVDVADGAAVTAVADHELNLAFHRDAIAFVTRPLASDPDANALGSIVRSISDPESRLTLRLEITRQNKQTNWSWDILYGYAVIRRELGARFLGGNA